MPLFPRSPPKAKNLSGLDNAEAGPAAEIEETAEAEQANDDLNETREVRKEGVPDQANPSNLENLSTLLIRTEGQMIPLETIKSYEDHIWQLDRKCNLAKRDVAFLLDYAKNVRFLFNRTEMSSSIKEEEDVTRGSSPLESGSDSGASIQTSAASIITQIEVAEKPKQRVPPIKLNELAFAPPKFDGRKPHPRCFLDDYEKAAAANAWSDAQMSKYLPAFLTQSAHDWYMAMGAKRMGPHATWRECKNVFVRHFLGDNDKESLKREIRNMVQGEHEPVAQFIGPLVRKLELAYPNKSGADMIEAVKRKLRPMYQEKLALQTIFDLEELNDYCKKIEKAQQDIREASKRSEKKGEYPVQLQKTTNEGRRKKKGSFRPTNSMSIKKQQPNNAGQMSELTCYKCGIKGHIAPNCKSQGRSPSTHHTAGSLRRDRVNSINPMDARTDANNRQSQKTRTVGSVMPACYNHVGAVFKAAVAHGSGELIEQTIKVNGEQVHAVVDTGAFVSVVDKMVAEKHSWQVVATDHQLIQAAGDQLECVGETNAEIELVIGPKRKLVQSTLLVVKSLCAPMLMGISLLRKLNINIDVNSSEPLSFKRERKAKGVRSIDTVEIPARSVNIITGRAETESKTVALSHCGVDSSLLIANTVCTVVDQTVPVVVANSDDRQVIVKAGQQIASFEALEENQKRDGELHVVNRLVEIQGTSEVVRIGDQLSKREADRLLNLLANYRDAFSQVGSIGCTNLIEHKIELTDGAKPFAEPMRRHPRAHAAEAERQVREMIADDIIEESDSPWASEYVIVRKKSGEYRLCVDYRRLNSLTKKNSFPLPNIESCLEALSGKRFFSQLDFASGYWQVPVAKEARELTAFRTPEGLYQYKRMPFGLCNAPATFQKLINGVFAGLKGLSLQVFLDDICIATETWPEHLDVLSQVLELTIKAKLRLKASKCLFGVEEVTFLGHLVSRRGIQQDPDKTKAILELPAPADVSATRRVLGALSYYRKFIQNFAIVAEPLTKLTKKGQPFVWGQKQQEAFDRLKSELKKNLNLHHFNAYDQVMVKCDASYQGIAGILLQKQRDMWCLITCCSRRLSPAESNYSVTDLEGLAIVYSLSKFRPYLLGREFQIVTDHCALCSLNDKLPASKRLQRWALILSEYNFKIIYMSGALHKDVDCLSRAPVADEDDKYLDRILAVAHPMDKASWAKSFGSPEDKMILDNALSNKNDFSFRDDIVYRKNQLYVPTKERPRMLRESHDSLLTLHDGVKTTLKRMSHLWWPNMANEVEEFVRKCEACQKRKAERLLPAGNMFSHEAVAPMELVAVDHLGPLGETVKGKKFICVFVDVFSRYTEAKAMESQTAEEFMLFLTELCGRFGAPTYLLSDNAKSFDCEAVRQLCSRLGINQRFSAPRHSRGNAVVERALQTLQEKLAFATNDATIALDWEIALPLAVGAMNTRTHKTTGYTPFEIMFGRKPRPAQRELEDRPTPHDVHNQIVQKHLEMTNADVVQATSDAQRKSRENFDMNHRNVEFAIGAEVLLKSSDRRKKLAMRYEGPFKVLSRANDIYNLQKVGNERDIRRRHASHLKLFHSTQQAEAVERNSEGKQPNGADKAMATPTTEPVSRRTRSKAAVATLFLALIRLSVASAALEFREVSPIFWTEVSNRFVSEVTVYAPTEIYFKSPCILLHKFRPGANTQDGFHVNNQVLAQWHRLATAPQAAPKMQQPLQVQQQQSYGPLLPPQQILPQQQLMPAHQMQPQQQLPYQHLQPQQQQMPPDQVPSEQPPAPSPEGEEESEDEGVDDRRRKRQLSPFDAAYAQCQAAFRRDITDPLRRFRDLATLETRTMPNRNKRQVAFLTGFFVSSIIHVYHEWTTAAAMSDRITLADSKMSRILEGMQVQQLINKAHSKTLAQFRKHIAQTDAMLNAMPEFSAVVAMLLDDFASTKQLLDRLYFSTKEGKPDLVALAQLYNTSHIEKLQLADSSIVKVDNAQDATLKVDLSGNVRAKHTKVYKVHAFDIYANLSETPVKMHYVGKTSLVRNEARSCIKAIDDELEPVVQVDCQERNFVDPQLQLWRQERTPNARKELKHSRSQIAYPSVLVYCWGNTISIFSGAARSEYNCPTFVFPVNINSSFETSDNAVRHVGKSAKHLSYDPAVLDVLQVHSNDTTSFLINSKMNLERIDELQERSDQLVQNGTAVEIAGHRVTWKATTWLALLLGVIILVTVILCHRKPDWRSVGYAFYRHATAPPQPTQQQTSQLQQQPQPLPQVTLLDIEVLFDRKIKQAKREAQKAHSSRRGSSTSSINGGRHLAWSSEPGSFEEGRC